MHNKSSRQHGNSEGEGNPVGLEWQGMFEIKTEHWVHGEEDEKSKGGVVWMWTVPDLQYVDLSD